jgi:hypothetical protein
MKNKQKEWHPTTKPLKKTPRAPSFPLHFRRIFLSRCQVINWAYRLTACIDTFCIVAHLFHILQQLRDDYE